MEHLVGLGAALPTASTIAERQQLEKQEIGSATKKNKTVFPAVFKFGAKLAQILEGSEDGIHKLMTPKELAGLGEYFSCMSDEAWQVNPKSTRKALEMLSRNLNLADGTNPLRKIAAIEKPSNDVRNNDKEKSEIQRVDAEREKQRESFDRTYTPLVNSLYSTSGDSREAIDQILGINSQVV